LTLEKPIPTGVGLGADVVDLLKQATAECEVQVRKTVKAYLLKCLNYFLQNAYNFEKFLPFILDQSVPVALAETALRTVVQQDLSLMLDNCFIQSTRDTHTARLQKYLNMITSPLRKISLLTYREAVGDGNKERHATVETFISVLVFLSEQVGEVMQTGEFSFGSFCWQSKVKHLLTFPRDKSTDDLHKQTSMESYLKQIDFSLKEVDIFSNLFYLAVGTRYLSNFELNLGVLNKLLPFGYQPVSNPHRPLFLPSTERSIVCLALAVSQEKLIAIRGQDASGKSSAVRYLARLAGRHLLTLDCSLTPDPGFHLRAVMSAAGCSHWVLLKHLHAADEAVLSQLARIVAVLKKHLDSAEKKQVTVEGSDFFLAPHYCLFWPQPSQVFRRDSEAPKIPPYLLAQFRVFSFVTCDLYTFIYAHLIELTFIEEYDAKLMQSLSRNLLLFFQQLQLGLTDKAFMTTCLNREFEVSVESLLLSHRDAWKLSVGSIKPIIKKIVHFLRMDQTSKATMTKTVFKAIYSVLKYQLSTQQKDALVLAYLSTFDPSADLFTVVDSAYLNDAFSIYSFFSINKIPAFSNIGLIENVNCLADSIHGSQPKAYLNFGRELQIYADTFNKLLLFSLTKRLECVAGSGFYFNLAYLDRDDFIAGQTAPGGMLSDFFSIASSGVAATPEYWLPAECKKYWYARFTQLLQVRPQLGSRPDSPRTPDNEPRNRSVLRCVRRGPHPDSRVPDQPPFILGNPFEDWMPDAHTFDATVRRQPNIAAAAITSDRIELHLELLHRRVCCRRLLRVLHHLEVHLAESLVRCAREGPQPHGHQHDRTPAELFEEEQRLDCADVLEQRQAVPHVARIQGDGCNQRARTAVPDRLTGTPEEQRGAGGPD